MQIYRKWMITGAVFVVVLLLTLHFSNYSPSALLDDIPTVDKHTIHEPPKEPNIEQPCSNSDSCSNNQQPSDAHKSRVQNEARTHPTVTESVPSQKPSSETPLHEKIDSRPNIVYMLADDLGYGDVQYNGGKARTPNLNAMADGPHSIHFSRFYSGGPSCSPTRGTLLTGRNHNRYCIWHADLGDPKTDLTCPSLGPLPSSELTVAEILKDIGYHTAIYGKWHVGDLIPIKGGNKKWPVSNPAMNGFVDWLVTERPISTLLPNCKCSPAYSCAMNGTNIYVHFCRDYWYWDMKTNRLSKYKGQIFEDSHFIVDQFEHFLKERNASVPFFVELSFHSVHIPYVATPHWFKYYQKHLSIPEREINYIGSISSMDEAIGRVRHLLQKYNIANNTMLWFSSDNGPQEKHPGSTGGLRGRKGTVFEGGIRVPGIIEWPGVITGNRKCSVPVVTSDFLPTVADILGIDIPEDITLDGISILPLLQNKIDRRDSNIKFAFHILKGNLNSNFDGAVVGDQYKYHAHFSGGKIQKFYLFDLVADRAETTNVSSSHIDLTVSMRAELDQFLQSVTESATQIGCLETHDRRESSVC